MTERPAAAGDGPEAAVEPVGTTLKAAREAAGLGLEEVARRLRFAPRQLDALERGDWGRLPGGAAVRGMVRQYARLLELDADALVARAGQGAPLPEQLAQRFQQPVPFSDGSRRTNAAYVALSLVLLVVVGAVAYQWRMERADRGRLNFVSAAQQPAEPARAPQAPAVPAGAVAASVTPASGTPQAVAPAPAASVPTGPRRRLVLRFEEEAWVEIHSGTGALLVSHLHPAGTERVVSGIPPFSIVIGNAQHVQLLYNDQPVDLMPHVKVEVARFTLE
ncbi:MAG: helix-turn-helix domain-containing protein [Betaproteobacteria bacterium]|nr:helix-turn-helix domain-containing protein [Betaproteobacteria bacterium]MDH5222473.1 helix-turn-helix domain-containing protein [Betaproteobacteria bacterium]MDH5351700.1 helix-turn-helix domain-containing protein [Betaproteobacteria bacterium]